MPVLIAHEHDGGGLLFGVSDMKAAAKLGAGAARKWEERRICLR
jgi:hypothetical protein